ncbi:hypothetical protein C0Q70_02125 [Pomacea canaliculata]|uniref:Uncharacterized protein n=1 Tax=Pomacea canaliculata TaxID=400727 RepID=A0A2T7Q1F0_POMCA|nr:hypothetical protein C0Q70_02125 [Pomacea canaliculata]
MGRCSSVPTAYVVAMVMLMASFALALAGVASPLWWESWPTPRVRLRWGLWQCAPSDAKTKCDSFTGGNGGVWRVIQCLQVAAVVLLFSAGVSAVLAVCVWMRTRHDGARTSTAVASITGGSSRSSAAPGEGCPAAVASPTNQNDANDFRSQRKSAKRGVRVPGQRENNSQGLSPNDSNQHAALQTSVSGPYVRFREDTMDERVAGPCAMENDQSRLLQSRLSSGRRLSRSVTPRENRRLDRTATRTANRHLVL